MKITYDETKDVPRILISESPIETVRQNGADQTLDYDQDGVLVGVELRNSILYLFADRIVMRRADTHRAEIVDSRRDTKNLFPAGLTGSVTVVQYDWNRFLVIRPKG